VVGKASRRGTVKPRFQASQWLVTGTDGRNTASVNCAMLCTIHGAWIRNNLHGKLALMPQSFLDNRLTI